MSREISYAQAILEATDQCMAEDPSVYVMGLGVTDPKGVFGTTVGLVQKYGSNRVFDMPVAENGMTGVAVGSSLIGMRPIMTHQRIDFMLLSLDQIINNASKWHYMFGGQTSVPMVIRLIVGRGWGQGPQHSQSLQSLFAHIPGLKVVMPTTPYDAKGLLVSAVRDNNPVIYIEHRWLHGVSGAVPEEIYSIPFGKAKIMKDGRDITIISSSYMTIEALKAAEMLEEVDISAEVVDLRTLKPLDRATIIESVIKTGRVIVVDGAWRTSGFASEIITIVVEEAFDAIKTPPQRLTFPDFPVPTSWVLANHYYPRAIDIATVIRRMLGIKTQVEGFRDGDIPLDVPEVRFTGPF